MSLTHLWGHSRTAAPGPRSGGRRSGAPGKKHVAAGEGRG
ncbi:hypothetical protein SLNWT_2439 [Streptomyces albus]|uniref:Uncharacterized protein n=1 Tax=Streptomyces albus (strain ATCC 21838 / DSM 41398 / FERM P-419 / JCM 4703 / NBRC 107858) TaxID=1081613 RepID=A0A0B5EUC5_STRA4|nr:hypothetical protein SLNWT_2439 [Streptomyces albus]AOU77127.1 hypothetical protein SLNHY_2436 [Streptomyces albus]AYN32905.1 hypothetical protein DUI70_2403 [Streptomyces albus]